MHRGGQTTARLVAVLLALVAGAAATTALVVGARDPHGVVHASAAYGPPGRPPTVSEAPRRLPTVIGAPRRSVGARAAMATTPPPLPHASRPTGSPAGGRLGGGVTLPEAGRDFFTWDLAAGTGPNPAWRRVGTDTLVAWLQGVLRWYRATNPGAPRVGVGDLSLPHGGPFGAHYGGLGHASHQNGLDVDVLYPRVDHAERPAGRPAEVDRVLAQRLVDAFVAAGAQFCFVGEHVGLTGPPGVVQALAHHDDHVHVRIAPLR